MRRYTYRCSSCNVVFEKRELAANKEISCVCCGGTARRVPPSQPPTSQVLETVNKYFNAKLDPEHEQKLDERAEKHFKKHQIHRLVQEYDLQTSIENGWVKYNSDGELVINDKE